MKRKAKILLSLGLLGTVGMATISSAAAKTQITFLANWYGHPHYVQWYKDAVTRFNAKSTDIKVNLIQGPFSEDKLMAMIVAGKAPDVVNFDRYKVGYWARAEMFEPVEKYLARDINLQRDFLPGAVQECMWKGKAYAVPCTTDIRGLFWNRRLVAEAGLDDAKGPQTWDEFMLYAKKLTATGSNGLMSQAGFVPWTGNWGTLGWIWTFGGDYFDEKSGKPTVDTPKNLAAYKWMADYAKTIVPVNVLNRSNLQYDNYAKQKVAMQVECYGAYDNWLKQAKNLDLWGGACPHPDGGKNGTWSGGFCYVITKSSKHKIQAGEFLSYLSSSDMIQSICKPADEIPPTYKGLEIVKAQSNPLKQRFMEQLPVSNHRRPFTDVIEQYLYTAQSQVITGAKSPEAALKEAQDKVVREHPSLWREKVSYKVK